MLFRSIYDYVWNCQVCEEVRRMNFEPPPMASNADLNLKPGDRLIMDWAEEGGHSYHLAVDSASGFLWAQEYSHKTTKESLEHLKTIIHMMGRYGEIHSDNGPSYREQWDTELANMGMDAVHGAPYHAQSQGLVEKNVDCVKQMIRKLGYLRNKDFQDMI